MNRLQERRKVINIYRLARKVGIDYINIDLMSGLPGQTVNSFVQTLQEILMLKPDTIHINSFWPISITPFARSGHQLTLTDLEKRRVMNKIGYQSISENCPYIIERDGLEKENIQIYNSSKFNSSLLGIGYGAFSHIRGRLHYIKKNRF